MGARRGETERAVEPLRPGVSRLWAALADGFASLVMWLPWECGKFWARPPPKSLVVRLGSGSPGFDKFYSQGSKIGQGSFGKVFECRDLCGGAGGAPLCVKVVPVRGHHVARIVNVSEDEKGEILSTCLRIDHPNIVKHYRFIQTDDALYTVMDQCRGLDLVDYVKEQGEHLPFDRIRLFAGQIFAAVAFVHALGMMHRDIKPENFRLKDSSTETLQLLDFGFAKPCSGALAAHSVTGTLLYAAPEVFDGFYSRQCDVWSCGVVVFQLFTGYVPFETSDVQILRSLHRDPFLTGDGLFRGAAQRHVPGSARSLIRGLLAVDPSERICAQTASDHTWLQEEDADGPEEDAVSRKSTLRRDNSRIFEQGEDASGIKRSYFVWDLAAASGSSGGTSDDGEDASTDTGP